MYAHISTPHARIRCLTIRDIPCKIRFFFRNCKTFYVFFLFLLTFSAIIVIKTLIFRNFLCIRQELITFVAEKRKWLSKDVIEASTNNNNNNKHNENCL